MSHLMFLILISLLLSSTQSASHFRSGYSQYVSIIDAGSTGSRFYLFKTHRNNFNEITKMEEIYSDECQPGINSYVKDLDNVWKPLYSMIKGSERAIYFNGVSIPLYIYATAGMRVLSESDQKAIYDAIYKGYSRSKLHFYMNRDMLRTINGEEEAIYGWITVNVLNARITPSLRYKSEKTIGSLDLGGESTQIAYQFVPHQSGNNIDFSKEIFSKSFLSFGAKEAQFRYENFILSNREVFRGSSDLHNTLHVPNPCNNKGLVDHTSVYEGLFHEGTGNLDQCESILATILHGESDCNPTSSSNSLCSIWSLSIPVFDVDFIGMSLYFFVVDFVRAIFQLDSSIQPSVTELKGYGKAFCSQSWSDVLQNYSGKHKFTNDAALKQRCFQIAYIVTLLEHGYKLKEESSHPPSIQFLRTINGESVDWTYGAALYMGRNPVPTSIKPIYFVVSFSFFIVVFIICICEA